VGAKYPEPHERDAAVRFIAKERLWDKVAARCGISSTSVRLWRHVPKKRLPVVEKVMGWPRRDIRPDLYK
jgi:hypothetical protein